jgi:hypothetical protein
VAAEDIAYRYTGRDPLEAHHGGIPARDLTESDLRALDKEQRDVLRHSPIYERVESAPAKAEEKKPDEKPETKAGEKK